MGENTCTSPHDALAGLRKWALERHDGPDGRTYTHPATGEVFHSVTRILGATAPEHQKKALERWLERPGSEQDRDMAATRGTLAHGHCEYILKTAKKLAIHTANRKGLWKPGKDGLERCPVPVTRWAIQTAIQGAPRVSWSASGYARGLRSWIEANVTAIHAVEWSGYHPGGWAGTCDCLADVAGALTICDWKTSQNARSEDMLQSYIDQLGAYSLQLQHLTGIIPQAGAVVVARRSGEPQCRSLSSAELRSAELRFAARAERYFAELAGASPE
jgi:hypothetical protein